MKKITLLFACAMFFGATATFAQDTTRTKKPDQTKQSDQLRKSDADEMKGYTKVATADVPESLRSTLTAGTQYKGWDDASRGSVYKSATGAYVVKIGEGTNKKVYHFDKDGNALKPH